MYLEVNDTFNCNSFCCLAYDCFNCLSQEDDRKLLREIGKNGEGRPDEVQQLIDEVFVTV